MKRLLPALAVLLSLSACSGGSDEAPAAEASPTTSAPSDATPAPTDATALSEDGDVQVWDLTGEPSDASFGIPDGETRADFSADEPRAVRFELDGGSFELDLADLTFYHEGDVFAFLSRTEELPADDLAAAYRDLIEQLDVDAATADAFEADLAEAQDDEAGQVTVSFPEEIRFGDWTVALSAAISPAAGNGILSVSSGYRPLPVS